jgi:type III secretory pathway lipoprotein EscJ
VRPRRVLLATLAALAAACAPQVGGPIEDQRARDREDSAQLAIQLAHLPGAVRADVTLHRPITDPLGASQPAGAAIVIVVDDHADRTAITDTARRLVAAVAPEIAAPAIAVEIGAIRPELARVGPFSVEAHTRGRLVATLAISLALIAALAAWIAVRERGYLRGRSAQ